MKTVAGLLLGIVALGFLGGSGILAVKIGETWRPENTTMLLMGATLACTITGIVGALVFAAIVGVKVGQHTAASPHNLPRTGSGGPNYGVYGGSQTPQLTSGSWTDSGAVVDLWPQDQAIDGTFTEYK